MKRLLFLLTLALTIFSLLAGCGGQAAIASQTPDAQTEPTRTSTPEPEKHVPMDVFGSGFNRFYTVQFPENFNIYAAAYSIGSKKIGNGRPNYV
ncbi:MAG: hypothetical protein QMB62_06780, partial [Oscillospiraceae bacterium]